MPLTAVLLDEGTRHRASEAQRQEWAGRIRELLEDASCNIDEPAALFIQLTEREFVLRFESPEGQPIHVVEVEQDDLSTHVTDYLDIVRQITAADGLNQMEALDMAKKVTHDRAGRVLKRKLRKVGFDLETSRRLFTLLLSLKVDTTKLHGLRAHRRLR